MAVLPAQAARDSQSSPPRAGRDPPAGVPAAGRGRPVGLPTPPKGWPIGSYPTYAEAQRAVDHLSDQQFPVEQVTIVGVDLMQVERVTGRLSWPKVLGGGVLTGAWLGLLKPGWLYTMNIDLVSYGGWGDVQTNAVKGVSIKDRELIEHGATPDIFSNPREKPTEDYITDKIG